MIMNYNFIWPVSQFTLGDFSFPREVLLIEVLASIPPGTDERQAESERGEAAPTGP